MENIYRIMAENFIQEMTLAIIPSLNEKAFEKEVNYATCRVEILNNDYSTIWVKWGSNYDCEFASLSPTSMATIVANIVNENKASK